MAERIGRRLLVMSETNVTVLGTLILSFGTNLVANLGIWSSKPLGVGDVLYLLVAAVSFYWAVVIWGFLESCRIWSRKRDEERDITELSKKKAEYIEQQMTSESVRNLVQHMDRCFWLSIVLTCILIASNILV